MDKQEVDEARFIAELTRWHITGRTLINLPRIEWRSGKLNISLISIDNGTLFELKRRFESYQQLLNWYGTVLDKLG